VANPTPQELACQDCGRPYAQTAHQQARSEWCPGEQSAGCMFATIARLRSELSTVKALSEAERAVVDALVAEGAARDSMPLLENERSRLFPSHEWWAAQQRLECAHARTEAALDALLALRKETDADR